MTEFLAENNICGRNLLRIVSVGNAIISEILRLKDYIPDVFSLQSKADLQKYGEIIFDFGYFRVSQAHEKKIESNTDLQSLDEEFRDNYIEILTRFYLAFESTHQYATDLQNFLEELDNGHYIQQSLESILQDSEGKQLMCESLYLFGVILIIIDLHIPGIIRERLLVSYYRYSANMSHGESNIDDVCKLLRSTGFVSNQILKRVPNYPESYFSRFTFDQNFIDMVIGRLRSDDIYNQLSIYPHPDHRSMALSNQAAMLYVCLYFSPKILQQQLPQMREITDKFFSDNWIVPIYMGITVNLIDAWEPYKAAKAALNTTIESTAIKNLVDKYKSGFDRVLPEIKQYLKEGVITESFLMQKNLKLLKLIRESNIVLRWFILHTSNSSVIEFAHVKRIKQLNDQIKVESGVKDTDLFVLLLNTSQLELKIKNLLKEILAEKVNRWNQFKKEAEEMTKELGDFFSGSRSLTKVEKNDDLQKWFLNISEQISSLDHENPNTVGRKIVQLIKGLENVQEFHNLDSNMSVKQYLLDTRQCLQNMIQIINIKDDMLINIQIVGDLSYAWCIIDSSFTNIMQDKIKERPKLVSKLRATFLKLASALEIPLLRINQAQSEDLLSVSQYYSNKLANYIRKVVQIIPKTIFSILAEIIHLQTEVIKEIPTRLEKDKLKEYAQLDERYKVSKLTYSISVFTEGVLMMKKTLVGIIELDPKQLLEDGIRKEIVIQLSNDLHEGLIFSAKNKPAELENKLIELSKKINGYKRSFEYVQDYLNLQGLKIWQEELTRVINYNVEKECNLYLRNKIQEWQSIYQNDTIPIPNFPLANNDGTCNFLGRLAKEILNATDPKTTIYLDLKGAWYERKTHKEIINAQLFSKIREALGPSGMIGLDRLFACMFINDLEQNIKKIQTNSVSDKMWQDILNSLIKELESQRIIPNPAKFYSNYTVRWSKVWPKLLDWILSLGHRQILRQHIAYELNRSSRFNAKHLESTLKNFNDALVIEYSQHQLDDSKSLPENKLISELNEYMELVGLYEPQQQLFLTTRNCHYVPLFLFLFTISHTAKLNFDRNVNSLIAKRSSDAIDGHAFIVGIITVLQQFHKNITNCYVDYLCQYIVSLFDSNLSSKNEFIVEIQMVHVHFVEIFIRTAKLSRKILDKKIPEAVLNQYEFILST